MKINEDILLKEIKILENKLNCNKNIFSQEYGNYYDFCELYNDITGIDNFGDLRYYNFSMDKLSQVLPKVEGKIYNYLSANFSVLFEGCKNYLNEFAEESFKNQIYYDKLRQYSDNEIKDITLDFYSKFGNNEYKIAKKYFDEQRIQYFNVKKRPKILGYHIYSLLLETGYIGLENSSFSSEALLTLVHEIGHAIDTERYLFTHQKKLLIFNDLSSEVLSTFYELAFNNYLVENKIDLYGGLTLNNTCYFGILNIATSLEEYFQNVIRINCGILEVENIEDLRDCLVYYLGYYLSIHLNLIHKDNPNEINKLFNTILSFRDELELKKIIEMIGIDIEDFKSGKLIYPVIKENNKKLTKMLSK